MGWFCGYVKSISTEYNVYAETFEESAPDVYLHIKGNADDHIISSYNKYERTLVLEGGWSNSKKIMFMKSISFNVVLLLVCFISVFIVEPSFAQQNSFSDRFSMKLGVAMVNAEPFKYNGEIIKHNYKPQFGITANYELINNLDVGLYIAYSNIGHMLDYEIEVVNNRIVRDGASIVPSHAFYYGLNFNYHVLSAIFSTKNLRLDLYPIANMGFVSRSWGEYDGTIVKIDPFLEYHFGLGFGYKFTRRFGLFGEYTMGRLYNEGRSKAALGFSLKF